MLKILQNGNKKFLKKTLDIRGTLWYYTIRKREGKPKTRKEKENERIVQSGTHDQKQL